MNCSWKSSKVLIHGVECNVCLYYKNNPEDSTPPLERCKWIEVPYRIVLDRIS